MISEIPAELYLDHLDDVIDAEPEFPLFGPEDGELPRAASIIYRDRPEAGLLTAFLFEDELQCIVIESPPEKK